MLCESSKSQSHQVETEGQSNNNSSHYITGNSQKMDETLIASLKKDIADIKEEKQVRFHEEFNEKIKNAVLHEFNTLEFKKNQDNASYEFHPKPSMHSMAIGSNKLAMTGSYMTSQREDQSAINAAMRDMTLDGSQSGSSGYNNIVYLERGRPIGDDTTI